MILDKIDVFILAGGQSKRFKEDKTLFFIENKPMIMHVVDKVFESANNLYIVSKDTGKYNFIKSAKTIKDITNYQTPLSGIYTACFHTDKPFLIIGADMPFIKKELISYLIKNHKNQATLFKINGFLEPLFGVYEPAIKDKIKINLDKNIFSINALLKELELNIISEEEALRIDKMLLSFCNINTKDDLLNAYSKRV